MSPLSVKYNHITCHQQELPSITYFPYWSMSSVDMAVKYNNLLQCKDFKETFKCSDTETDGEHPHSATKIKITVT